MTKKLYRSQTEKVLGGVCGGLGKYYEIDPVIVRILFVLITLAWGVGIVAYIIAIFIIPKEQIAYQEMGQSYNQSSYNYNQQNYENASYENTNTGQNTYNYEEKTEVPSGTKRFFAYTLIVIGGIILLDDFVNVLQAEYIIPSILILAGVYLLFNDRKK